MRVQAPPRRLRELAGQEALLDQVRDAQLLRGALTVEGLDGLLAHELGDPQRRGRLRGQVGEQLAVVRGVVAA